MATVLINLNNKRLNVSLQTGDILYFADTVTDPPINPWVLTTGITYQLGPVISINSIDEFTHEVWCSVDPSTVTLPQVNDYLMFAKDNRANMSSVRGYYAEVTFLNDSIEPAELYAVSSDVSESSN